MYLSLHDENQVEPNAVGQQEKEHCSNKNYTANLDGNKMGEPRCPPRDLFLCIYLVAARQGQELPRPQQGYDELGLSGLCQDPGSEQCEDCR